MALTAKARARTALFANTTLNQTNVLDLVKQATEQVAGGGLSLMTSGIMNAGARVHVERESEHGFSLSITSGKRLLELCTFGAVAKQREAVTDLQIGGLLTYKTSQPRFLGFIPAGPASITGFSLYKRFLDEVAQGLRAADPEAKVTIEIPAA